MKSNADKSLDPLRPSFWKSWLISTLLCLVGGIAVGTCSPSLIVSFLTYSLLLFMPTALVVYRPLLKETLLAYENC